MSPSTESSTHIRTRRPPIVYTSSPARPAAAACLQDPHRRRVRALETVQRLRRRAGRRPVHRRQHRHLGACHASPAAGSPPAGTDRPLGSPRSAPHRRTPPPAPAARSGRGQPAPTRTRRSAATAGRRSAGRLCSPDDAVIRPARTIAARPSAPQPPVRHVLVEPPVSVRGRDPLRLAPRQQRLHHGMRATMLFELSRSRVRHVDPDAPQHRPHIGRVAQIDRRARPRVLQNELVPRPLRPFGIGVPLGAGPDRGGDDPLCLDRRRTAVPARKARRTGTRPPTPTGQSTAHDPDRSAPPVFAAARPPRSAPTAPTSQPARATRSIHRSSTPAAGARPVAWAAPGSSGSPFPSP